MVIAPPVGADDDTFGGRHRNCSDDDSSRNGSHKANIDCNGRSRAMHWLTEYRLLSFCESDDDDDGGGDSLTDGNDPSCGIACSDRHQRLSS